MAHYPTVYSTVLDIHRGLACSGSMDGTVQVWNTNTGSCQYTLTGHESLVGILALSPSFLISASGNTTLRVWNPDSGDLKYVLKGHRRAVACMHHDEFKLLSVTNGALKMWDIRKGSLNRDLLIDVTGVWQVATSGRWCVAASSCMDTTFLDVWDFGDGCDDGGRDCELPEDIYDQHTFEEVGGE